MAKRRTPEKKGLDEILDLMNFIFVVLDEKAGISFINEFGARMLGRKRENLAGLNWIENFVPRDRRKEVSKVFRSLVAGKRVFSVHTNPVIGKGRRKIEIFWTNYIQKRGERKVLSIGKPVSGEDNPEIRLYEKEEKYQRVLGASGDMVYILDAGGRIRYVNEAIERLGFEREKIVGRGMKEICHEEDFPEVMGATRRMFRTKKTCPVNFRLRTVSGETAEVEQKSRFFFDDELRKSVLICYARDITRIKKLQEQVAHLYKMEALGNMAGQIAHDFNNVLGAIEGYVSVIGMYAEKNTQLLADLGEIKKAVKEGSDLTRQLLLFSKKKTAGRENISPVETFREIRPLIKAFVPDRIKTGYGTRGRIPDVKMIKANYERILINLILNCRDALEGAGKKQGKINVLFEKVKDAAVPQAPVKRGYSRIWVKISVEDNGPGISPEHMDRIFEPFFTTKPEGKGTGLGLSIVYSTVKNAGGQITVESEKGKFTRFGVYLPAASGAEKRKKAPGAAEKKPEKKEIKNILLIEDEDNLRNSAGRALETMGYRIYAAPGETEAMEAVRKEKIDLVFSDIVLKDGNGIDICEKIKRRAPRTAVILTSGYIRETREVERITEKNFVFIPKPYNLEEVVAVIKKVKA